MARKNRSRVLSAGTAACSSPLLKKAMSPSCASNSEGPHWIVTVPCITRKSSISLCQWQSTEEKPSSGPMQYWTIGSSSSPCRRDSFMFLNSLVLIGNTTFPSAVCQNRYKI